MDAALLQELRDLRARVERLERADARGTIAARYTSSNGQVVTGSTSVVNFATRSFDDLDLVQTGTGWQFVAPTDGIYGVQAMIAFDTTAVWQEGRFAVLYAFKNGVRYATLNRTDRDTTSTAGTRQVIVPGMTLVPLTAGDTIAIYAVRTSGTPLSLRSDDTFNYVSIWRL